MKAAKVITTIATIWASIAIWGLGTVSLAPHASWGTLLFGCSLGLIMGLVFVYDQSRQH